MIKVARSPAIDNANPIVLIMLITKSADRFGLCKYHSLVC